MSQRRASFCVALNVEAGKAPEWVELIPAPDAAGKVAGRDGRAWLWDGDAHNAVMTAFNSRGIDLAIDWNHATQLRASEGGEAPAAGWVSSIEIRGNALWGKVAWTPRGETQVANREYRYLSPVFDFEKSTGRIARMVTAGLTNTPNLFLSALNHEENHMSRSALLIAAMAAALALPADATDDALAQAINTMKSEKDTATARNSEVPSLDRYVPRDDFNALMTRATNAENSLQERSKAEFKSSVDTAISDALKAGKITPATEAYHRAACADADGLKRFREFVGAAVAVGGDTNLGERRPDSQATSLNAEEQAVCRATGVSEKDFVAARNAA